ncbi:MAG TPA: hypothetical protein VMO81_05120 [Aestuariivirgaceae bacterium]|nr:hypothetical protein [Aestuariivirgaceae bacterium]
MTAPESLETIVARTAGEPVAPEIEVLAEAMRNRHEPGALAVIAYGSSLRGVGLTDTLIDLYVLTGTVEAVSPNRVARQACRLVPPNVHYGEARHGAVTLRAKYAVLPLDQFARRMGQGVTNPYFWARFAQPCRIVWVRDEEVRRALIAALAQAARTMIAASLPLGRPGDDALDLWRRGLAETYRTELRPEPADRAHGIVAANAPWYRAVTETVLGPGWIAGNVPPVSWGRRRVAGKALSVLRLLKAGFTFEGGADYVAWKIACHSGQAIDVKPWQRRHPVLGALWLLPGLLRRGALR